MKNRFLFCAFLCFSVSGLIAQTDSMENKKVFQLSGNIDAYYRHSGNETESTTHFPTLRHGVDFGWANLAGELNVKGFYALLDMAYGPRGKAFAGSAYKSGVQQAVIGYNFTKKYKLTAGYMYFPFNVEYPQAGQNTHYSYSILYSMIPVAYSGIKQDITINDYLSVWAAVYGAPNDRFKNSSPHPAAGVYYEKEKATLGVNFLTGNDAANYRNTQAEIFASYQITPKFSATVNYQWGQNKLLGTDFKLKFSSVVGYLKYDFTPNIYIALRAEQFNDPDKLFFRDLHFSDNLKIRAYTLSPRFSIGKFHIQPELRLDRSSESIFIDYSKIGYNSKQEFSALLALIYKFGTYPE
jgi:Putative beta-barrel porin-2, OmpL-like. bbp2